MLQLKQAAFVEHYLRVWNAAEAARLAGYSAKTARQQGSRLLTNVDIQDHIAERLDELKMSADEVLTRLSDIARGDMRDFVSLDKDGEPLLNLTQAQAAGKLHLIRKVKRTRRVIKEMTETTVEIELYDAQAALVTLGKHHRLFADRLEVDWQRALEEAGLNPGDEFEQMVQEFEKRLRASDSANDGGGTGGGEATGGSGG